MDRLAAMRLYTRVVERRSFTAAAVDMDLPRSTVTKAVREMETRLGVRLLQRTTRVVRPTLDGEAYYRRCLTILNDIEEAEDAFRNAQPKGELRVEVQGTLARHFLMPSLPEFFTQYPDIALTMSESDRWVDIVAEGVDCALRYGKLRDSDLVARQVAMLERITCATPAYLEKFGTPASLDELHEHRRVALRSVTSGNITPLEFNIEGEPCTLEIPHVLSVTGTESYLAGIRLGLGLAQAPIFHIQHELKNRDLIPILTDFPVPSAPVSIVYSTARQLSPRVRVFIDWAAHQFTRHNLTLNQLVIAKTESN